jgi:phosphoglycolate phosphatase-like HAD superfamily hydrolase
MLRRVAAPRAILLDLDGTLVDASEAIAEGVIELARELGLRVPERAWAAARVGYSPHETWGLLGAADPVACVALFRDRYLPGLPARTRILPGVQATLCCLAGRGLLLGVATTRSAASARDTLDAAGLLPHLAAVGGGDEVAHHKPAPDVLHLVLGRLACRPEHALMVGDTSADVLAARAAGMPCWAVLGGTHDEPTLREAGADRILSGGIAELPEALGLRAATEIPRE